MVLAERDGAPVAGLTPKTDGRMPTVWTVYFATPDVRALCRRVRAAGGRDHHRAHRAGRPLGALGSAALVTDPEGAVLGLWQAGRPRRVRPPPRSAAPSAGPSCTPGTPRPSTASTAPSSTTRCSAPTPTPDFGRVPVTGVFPAEMPPHFLVHFGVGDCEEALRSVGRLGGRVQVPPFEASYGRVAVVTDNQGASFAVLER